MPVRKTESRIPANFQASDLGQAVLAVDGRCALISFITSPIVVNRDNIYVLFVTDQALAGTAQSFEWTFTENDGAPDTQTTQHGEITYRPQSTGKLILSVRILDPGNTEQASLKIEQEVVLPSAELEMLISEARNEPGLASSVPMYYGSWLTNRVVTIKALHCILQTSATASNVSCLDWF